MPTSLDLSRSGSTRLRRSVSWHLCLAFGACGWFATAAVAAETRTWTDSTGKFKIQAEFVSEQNGNVTLRQTDGSEVEIPVNKLSKPDQDYLKTQRDNPFQPKTASPFQPRTMPAGGGGTPASPAARDRKSVV